jgi:predicted AAA+ superfamily ATPase
MATSNRDRVGSALELVGAGLRPFCERELRNQYGDQVGKVLEQVRDDAHITGAGDPFSDVHFLLKLMWDQWNSVFRKVLGQAERTYVSELRDARNRWAHQEPFTIDDTYRTLDTSQRLLASVSAEEAVEIDSMKQDVMRRRYEDQARVATKKAGEALTAGQPTAGLGPWREIIAPHQDVASGTFQQAEFAADLAQVHRGGANSEYQDPVEFFRRTYITSGLHDLLELAIRRASGTGGDPVVALQTNFGGGKTHSLLALYHLFSGISPADLPGVEPVMKEAGEIALPPVKRAVLVGTNIAPGSVHEKPDGTKVRTLWGELAWQIGGAEGYAIVADDDAKAKNPGDNLRKLFEAHGPCLVLIDEWVAYARQLPRTQSAEDIPAGTFDVHFSFAQALTEAAKAAKNALLVVSMPASDIEKGGEAGEIALERLENLVGRQDSPWRPASADESFEIVRRRLFNEVEDHASRDAVVKAYLELYKSQSQEFPSECREADYERRMKSAYPIHPELFQRLYDDWSSLENFQRTRGVLRLMAAVIHVLWESNDQSTLILPGVVPVGYPSVKDELTRYLDDSWVPVIDRDVDGDGSLPLRLEQENPILARVSAARRVARSVFLGSAATHSAAHRGLEDQRIKLGCVQPGESPAVFGDALRRLTDGATHLYQEGQRYWYSTQPTVNRLAQDRASQRTEDDVSLEISRRLKTDTSKGDFALVHVAPEGPSEVPDESRARLVVLGPEHQHSGKVRDSEALRFAGGVLEERGTGPRNYRNTLVFVAPDKTRLGDLGDAVRMFLAWSSIVRDKVELNLDPQQARQAEEKLSQAASTVDARMKETYIWTLVPMQDPSGNAGWKEVKVPGGPEPLADRASRKLKDEEDLLTSMAGPRLRLEIDRVPLWDGNHVSVRQLRQYFAQYLYLPRLRDESVLVEAIQDGANRTTWNPETFAYADRFDANSETYVGLVARGIPMVQLDSESVLVKPEIAAAQKVAEGSEDVATPTAGDGGAEAGEPGLAGDRVTGSTIGSRRFHGAVRLDPVRASRDASQIAEAVIQHLAALHDARVQVTLEILAEIPSGAPDDVVRTVTENARTLKFETFGFEDE